MSRQFKTEIMALGSNVKENVAGGGDSVAAPRADLSKRMKFSGTGRPKEFVPGIGPESGDAGEARFHISKFNGAYEPGKICAERTKSRAAALIGVDADNQKDRRACKRTNDRLWKNDFV
jgi:hypothetical protein